MGRLLRGGILFTLLLAFAAPAAAVDPVLMFLLNMAREVIESQAARAPAPAAAPLPEQPRVYPGTMVEPEDLRKLIDESFLYLSESQRREVFESLHAALLDPKNAAVRATMIDYFADKARTVRAAQLRLSQLSRREQELLAGEFKKEIATLPAEDQARVGELLRRGLLPVPSDFNQLLLSAFDER
ncbi:MAG: hypothetical protein HYS35_01925 [Betaproteobacteria bacterium]|nr:hypothetical protein [Betaproteobacteria bacterium]